LNAPSNFPKGSTFLFPFLSCHEDFISSGIYKISNPSAAKPISDSSFKSNEGLDL